MATFAAMLKDRGHQVRGSDQDVYPPMSELLAEKGIELRAPYGEANLDDPEPDLVVVGNAIPRGNAEMEAVLDRGIRYRSFPELLREEFLEGRHPVVISGTHGKTTTTAFTGVALLAAGLDPSVLVGGYVRDLGGSYRLGDGAPFVIEGDEYDTAWFDKTPKFLKYFPRTLVVNNLEFDHADIYDSLDAIKLQFRRLVHLVPRSGRILVGDAFEHALEITDKALSPVETFGLAEGSDWRAVDIEDSPAGVSFTFLRGEEELGRASLPFSGEHSVRNALAALAVTVSLGGDFAQAARGLAAMEGVRRRLELRGEERGVLVYDDFAHHPTAVTETIKAARSRHPGARVWALFEPRSWTSRRKVHEEAFAEAFAQADRVVLAPVFQPERLDPSIRLEPEVLVDRVRRAGGEGCVLPDADAIAAHVASEAEAGDVVLVMSNGAFGGVHEKLLSRLGT
jgi:UDP-N-acetylmuramate: L-alanyl-gamma-D-glutamyl-meso-diaminopimelate ligase